MAFSVDNYEMYGWPRGKWEAGDFTAERRVMVAWDDRVTYLAELEQYPNFCYPYSDGPDEATAVAAEVLPFGKSTAAAGSALADYEYAIIRIVHTTKGPKYSQLWKFSVHEMLLPCYDSFAVEHEDLAWSSDSEAVKQNEAPVHDDVQYEYIVTLDRTRAIPAAVFAYPNQVCNHPFKTAFLGRTFPEYTLRFVGATVRATYGLGISTNFTSVLKFKYKPSEWNKFWRPSTGQWETMKAGSTQYIQYPTATWGYLV